MYHVRLIYGRVALRTTVRNLGSPYKTYTCVPDKTYMYVPYKTHGIVRRHVQLCSVKISRNSRLESNQEGKKKSGYLHACLGV
jgi:hypothetical protein